MNIAQDWYTPSKIVIFFSILFKMMVRQTLLIGGVRKRLGEEEMFESHCVRGSWKSPSPRLIMQMSDFVASAVMYEPGARICQRQLFSLRTALIIWNADSRVRWVHSYKWGMVESMVWQCQLGLPRTRQGFISIHSLVINPAPHAALQNNLGFSEMGGGKKRARVATPQILPKGQESNGKKVQSSQHIQFTTQNCTVWKSVSRFQSTPSYDALVLF